MRYIKLPRGFTLIELLISMALLMLLISLSMFAFNQVQTISTKVANRNSQEQRLARKLLMVRTSLESALDYYQKNKEETRRSIVFNGDANRVYWVSRNAVSGDGKAVLALLEVIGREEGRVRYREWTLGNNSGFKPTSMFDRPAETDFDIFDASRNGRLSYLALDDDAIRLNRADWGWTESYNAADINYMPRKVKLNLGVGGKNFSFIFEIKTFGIYKRGLYSDVS